MSTYKYRCNDCGKEFDEPGQDWNSLEFWGAPCREYYDCCPYCGGDFEEKEETERGDNGLGSTGR